MMRNMFHTDVLGCTRAEMRLHTFACASAASDS